MLNQPPRWLQPQRQEEPDDLLAPLGPASLATSAVAVELERALRAPPGRNEPHQPVSSYSTACPDCTGAGFYKLAVPFGHPDFGKLFPCACKQAERSEHAARRRAEVLSQLADELGYLKNKRLDTFQTSHPDRTMRRTLERALQEAKDYVRREFEGWLYLWGPCNTGKSHLAAGLALAAADAGLRTNYASVPSLLRFLKDGFADGSSDQRMVALQVVDCLVLDDLGTEHHRAGGYDYNDSVLFEIVNARQLANRATIITSNLPVEDHEPRLAARIRRAAREIVLDVDDFTRRQR